jgi:hypothetical protein
MKIKSLRRKLVLNKQTIGNLESREMNSLRVGEDTDPYECISRKWCSEEPYCVETLPLYLCPTVRCM